MRRRLAFGLFLLAALIVPIRSTSAAGGATWTETLLHVFGGSGYSGGFLDGKTPAGKLIVDSMGNLYGATRLGAATGGSGAAPECQPIQNGNQTGSGCGLAYELSPPAAGTTYWPERVLHVFTGGTDAEYPVGGLVAGAKGILFGAADGGRSNACNAGCAYSIDPGTLAESVIYRWPGSFGGGSAVNGDLVVGPNGSLYGTTASGGTYGFGTAFELTPPAAGSSVWTKRVLYAFSNGRDGGSPNGALLIDGRGALYGTTQSGGSSTACNFQGHFPGGYCGVIYKLTPPQRAQDPWSETVLYSFTGKLDGGIPNGALIADRAGSLFGTTQAGGRVPTFDLTGVAFELRPAAVPTAAWTLHVLHTFGGAGDGSTPVGGLISRRDARVLYGVTSEGGPSDEGSAFRLRFQAAGWSETILHSFNTSGDGYQPLGGLVAYGCRNLFGATSAGGPYTGAYFPAGTVFEIAEQFLGAASPAWKKEDCRKLEIPE